MRTVGIAAIYIASGLIGLATADYIVTGWGPVPKMSELEQRIWDIPFADRSHVDEWGKAICSSERLPQRKRVECAIAADKPAQTYGWVRYWRIKAYEHFTENNLAEAQADCEKAETLGATAGRQWAEFVRTYATPYATAQKL